MRRSYLPQSVMSMKVFGYINSVELKVWRYAVSDFLARSSGVVHDGYHVGKLGGLYSTIPTLSHRGFLLCAEDMSIYSSISQGGSSQGNLIL